MQKRAVQDSKRRKARAQKARAGAAHVPGVPRVHAQGLDVPRRDAAGWPVGDFSYTTNDGTVHQVTHWWDDDPEEVRTRCRHYFKDEPDRPTKQVTCLFCIMLDLGFLPEET